MVYHHATSDSSWYGSLQHRCSMEQGIAKRMISLDLRFSTPSNHQQWLPIPKGSPIGAYGWRISGQRSSLPRSSPWRYKNLASFRLIVACQSGRFDCKPMNLYGVLPDIASLSVSNDFCLISFTPRELNGPSDCLAKACLFHSVTTWGLFIYKLLNFSCSKKR